MVLDNSGNVGIGTDSPDRKLHVKDVNIVVSEFEGTNTGSLMDLVNSNASQLYNGIRFTQGATGKMAITHIADGTTKGYIQIGNSWATGSEILVVDGRTSNVGIGETNPGEKLEVNGRVKVQTSSGSLTLKELGTSSATIAGSGTVGIEAVGNFRVKTNTSNETFTVLSSGNVGIGITAPTQKLHVAGNARVTGAY